MDRLAVGKKVKIRFIYSPSDDADTSEWAGQEGVIIGKRDVFWLVSLAGQELLFARSALTLVQGDTPPRD